MISYRVSSFLSLSPLSIIFSFYISPPLLLTISPNNFRIDYSLRLFKQVMMNYAHVCLPLSSFPSNSHPLSPSFLPSLSSIHKILIHPHAKILMYSRRCASVHRPIFVTFSTPYLSAALSSVPVRPGRRECQEIGQTTTRSTPAAPDQAVSSAEREGEKKAGHNNNNNKNSMRQ